MKPSKVAELFKFTPDDLDANRNGALSASQREQFDQKRVPSRREFVQPLLMMTLIFIVAPGVGMFFAWRAFETSRHWLAFVAFAFLSMVTLAGLQTVFRILHKLRLASLSVQTLLREDVQAGRVERAVVRVQTDPDGEHVYLANVERDLWLSHAEVDALPMGGEYIAYYLPQSETVLSLEVVTRETDSGA